MSGAPARPSRPPGTAPGAAPRGLLGVGTGGLVLEAIVLLLAAPAVASLERGHVSGLGVGYLLLVAALLIGAAAVLRRPHGVALATAVQPLVVAGGTVTWPMYVVGVLFALIWGYYLSLWRRTRRPA
jgi:Protein of unknown function (DUF4233)